MVIEREAAGVRIGSMRIKRGGGGGSSSGS